MIYFVATPIGNLKDITLRALEVLRGASVVFCEDTRHSLKLLNAYGIKKPLMSCHKFNEKEAAEKIIAAAQKGDVAIISDAGMPAVSDPGNGVCRALKEAGEPYTVIPGANAALSALVLSAFDSSRFAFAGFLPDKGAARKRALEELKTYACTLIFHVAPQDMDKTVKELFAAFGERRACAVREITKIHEEAAPFLLSEGLKGEKRGEYVLIVEGCGEVKNPLAELSAREHVSRLMAEGLDKKAAVKRAAKERGEDRQSVYMETLDL